MRNKVKVVGQVFVANCVTLGTRVHFEVLKAIAKECCNAAEDMFLYGITSRLVLWVKLRSGAQIAHTFVFMIERYVSSVKEADLGLA